MFWALQQHFARVRTVRRMWKQMQRDGIVPRDYTLHVSVLCVAVITAVTVLIVLWAIN